MKYKILISLLLLQACSNTPAPHDTMKSDPTDNTNSRQNHTTSAQQTSIQNKQWQLLSYANGQAMQKALAKHPANIQFSGQKISGSTGCNRYFAGYQLGNNNSLSISRAGASMMACPDDMAQQEQHYLRNLADIHFYHIQNEQLQLLDAQQQIRLIFTIEPALSLQGTTWQVTGINNGLGGVSSDAHTKKAMLQFTQNELQGHSGCNTLSARYQSKGRQLEVGAIRSTRKYCRESGLMTQEKRILAALAQVKHYEIHAQQLRLLNAEGALMLSLKAKI